VNPTGILTPTATRALLAQLGHTPRRQLGQNFLVDGNIVRKSLELASVAAGDRVVEVGPGLGTLTTALLEAGAEVFAIELDRTMAAHLRSTLEPTAGGSLHLLEGDAVEHPLGSLAPRASNDDHVGAASAAIGDVSREPIAAEAAPAAPTEAGRFKIVANLPYAISSPWMEAVLAGPLPERMVLMLQLEAAQRYAAAPGSKSFGAISVFLQAAFRVAPGHRVSRTCFFPVPDVDSTLLNLERLDSPYAFSAAGRALVRSLFQHRRKQLASVLRRAAPAAAERWLPHLSAAGVRPDARAEDVPVAAWIELDRVLSHPGKVSSIG
jgi:16S rRNA (adenine1518-N6/adenine1519-N6)-dimethyltransferase